MLLTESKLRQIVKEEYEAMMKEAYGIYGGVNVPRHSGEGSLSRSELEDRGILRPTKAPMPDEVNKALRQFIIAAGQYRGSSPQAFYDSLTNQEKEAFEVLKSAKKSGGRIRFTSNDTKAESLFNALIELQSSQD